LTKENNLAGGAFIGYACWEYIEKLAAFKLRLKIYTDLAEIPAL
jgi:hypothetical protein